MAKMPLSADELARNFADLHPPFTRYEALAEAARCLFCWDAPCSRACPTGIDVPGFIRQILHDNPSGAAETIFRENILGGSCARACPTEVLCEGFCVDRVLKDGPVQIEYFLDSAGRPYIVSIWSTDENITRMIRKMIGDSSLSGNEGNDHSLAITFDYNNIR